MIVGCYLVNIKWIMGAIWGWYWMGLGCCLVDVGYFVRAARLVFGCCQVGYWWESWCRVLLGDRVVDLVIPIVVG